MFLDIGIGIFSSIFVSWYFGISIEPILVITGVVLVLLPDVDFVFSRIVKYKLDKGYEHRNIIHYPLIYLPLGCLIFFILFGKVWAVLFLITSFLHLIHDSIAYGRGIKWLYPFSKDGYAFIYLYSRTVGKGLWKPLFIFNKETIAKFDDEHGDEDWIKNIYHKWHPIAIVEFVLFIISLIVLYFYAN